MRLSDVLKNWRVTAGRLFTGWFGGMDLGAALSGQLTTLVYGPLIAIDVSAGNEFRFTITDNVAFVLSNPTNPPPTGQDQVIRVTYINASGGAHGAGTFGNLFKPAGNFTAVATANQRTIAFRWDGTNWVELWRGATDVPV